MAIDGFEWDAPDSKENAAAFGFPGTGEGDRPAFPKLRVVSISECASHAVVDAVMGGVAGKGAGEQSLARKLYRRLVEDWLLIADRNFFNWADWCTAADSGAQLVWRVKADLTLAVLDLLPDGSYRSVLVSPKIRGKARQALIEAARAGQDLDEDQARYVRVVEYEVPDRTHPGSRHGRHHPQYGPQPQAPPPDLPQGGQASRHNSYRVKRPGDHGTRHPGPPTISLVNDRQLTLAA
jgi:hypothetical protein